MRRPASLSSAQRKKLRGLAHELVPIVMVGKDGVTPGVITAVQAALDDHELIKVRVLDSSPLPRKEVGEALEQGADVHHVSTIGRTVILYNRHPTRPVVPI